MFANFIGARCIFPRFDDVFFAFKTGKGVEDKRGQPVTPMVSNKSWLYLGGRCVVCDMYMAVAAMVTSINPSIAADVDSRELNSLQQVNYLNLECDHLECCIQLAAESMQISFHKTILKQTEA